MQYLHIYKYTPANTVRLHTPSNDHVRSGRTASGLRRQRLERSHVTEG